MYYLLYIIYYKYCFILIVPNISFDVNYSTIHINKKYK